jgi:serpin B
MNSALPKFFPAWSELKRDLSRLGLSLPFSPEAAHLRGMCNGDDDIVAGTARRPTFLSKVVHKAVVKVNEVGTEAALVTVAIRGGSGPPPGIVEFTADHPFTFFIMEERSGVIVFTGHVLDPTK